MARPSLPCLLALALAASPAAAQEPIQIAHTPPGCFQPGRFPVLRARLSPIANVMQARLLFRTDPSAEPHALEMRQTGEEFEAVLPRPTAALRAVRYWIEATDPALNEVTSAEVAVPVLARCEKAAPSRKSARPEVSPPLGAALVPAGFEEGDAAQLGAPEEPKKAGIFNLSPAASAVAAIGVLAVGATVVTVGVDEPDPVERPVVQEAPGITFVESNPAPGGSVRAGPVGYEITVRMVAPQFVSGISAFEMRQVPGGPVCAASVAGATVFLEANLGRNITIRGLTATGACGPPPFEVSTVRVLLAPLFGTTTFTTGSDYPDLALRYTILP